MHIKNTYEYFAEHERDDPEHLLIEHTDEHFAGHKRDAPELDVAALAVGGGHNTAAVIVVGEVPRLHLRPQVGHHSVLAAAGVEALQDQERLVHQAKLVVAGVGGVEVALVVEQSVDEQWRLLPFVLCQPGCGGHARVLARSYIVLIVVVPKSQPRGPVAEGPEAVA